jgi:hypothetical protein
MQGRTGAAKERSGPGANRPQMAVQLTAEDEEFRGRIRSWLEVNLSGEFAAPRGLGGPGREHEHCERRLAWNRARLARRRRGYLGTRVTSHYENTTPPKILHQADFRAI